MRNEVFNSLLEMSHYEKLNVGAYAWHAEALAKAAVGPPRLFMGTYRAGTGGLPLQVLLAFPYPLHLKPYTVTRSL